MDDLLQFCRTESQCKTLEAVIRCGTTNKASKDLGVSHRAVNKTMNRLRKYKNIHHSPGFNVKGKSTLFDADGNVKIEWVKTERDKAKDDQILETITDVFSDYKGTVKVKKAPKAVDSDLLTIYPMGDPHIGLYAWAEECGQDFDCDIAERDLIQATSNLVAVAPNSHTALIANLGDFFHSDSQSNTTARSGHALDVDTRWAKVLQIGVKVMIHCIEIALIKHKKVIVHNAIGNHDDHTSQMLSIALSCFFSKNKRVEINTTPSKFYYYQHGKCLIGVTHGDTVKPAALPNVMACDMAKEWGETEHRVFHTGHIHHDSVKDFPGCRFESHRTLAAKDAWHAAQGYRSQRDMKCVTYHKEYGEDSRFTMSINKVRQS